MPPSAAPFLQQILYIKLYSVLCIYIMILIFIFSSKTYPHHSAVIFPRQPPHKFKSVSPSSCKAFCHLSSTPHFCLFILKVFTHSFCSQKGIYCIRFKQISNFAYTYTVLLYFFPASCTEDTVLLDMHVLYRALSITLVS